MINIFKIQSPMNEIFQAWAFLYWASITFQCPIVRRGLKTNGRKPVGRRGGGRGLTVDKHYQLAEPPAPDD
jgi:hypothetical protein